LLIGNQGDREEEIDPASEWNVTGAEALTAREVLKRPRSCKFLGMLKKREISSLFWLGIYF